MKNKCCFIVVHMFINLLSNLKNHKPIVKITRNPKKKNKNIPTLVVGCFYQPHHHVIHTHIYFNKHENENKIFQYFFDVRPVIWCGVDIILKFFGAYIWWVSGWVALYFTPWILLVNSIANSVKVAKFIFEKLKRLKCKGYKE